MGSSYSARNSQDWDAFATYSSGASEYYDRSDQVVNTRHTGNKLVDEHHDEKREGDTKETPEMVVPEPQKDGKDNLPLKDGTAYAPKKQYVLSPPAKGRRETPGM